MPLPLHLQRSSRHIGGPGRRTTRGYDPDSRRTPRRKPRHCRCVVAPITLSALRRCTSAQPASSSLPSSLVDSSSFPPATIFAPCQSTSRHLGNFVYPCQQVFDDCVECDEVCEAVGAPLRRWRGVPWFTSSTATGFGRTHTTTACSGSSLLALWRSSSPALAPCVVPSPRPIPSALVALVPVFM